MANDEKRRNIEKSFVRREWSNSRHHNFGMNFFSLLFSLDSCPSPADVGSVIDGMRTHTTIIVMIMDIKVLSCTSPCNWIARLLEWIQLWMLKIWLNIRCKSSTIQVFHQTLVEEFFFQLYIFSSLKRCHSFHKCRIYPSEKKNSCVEKFLWIAFIAVRWVFKCCYLWPNGCDSFPFHIYWFCLFILFSDNQLSFLVNVFTWFILLPIISHVWCWVNTGNKRTGAENEIKPLLLSIDEREWHKVSNIKHGTLGDISWTMSLYTRLRFGKIRKSKENLRFPTFLKQGNSGLICFKQFTASRHSKSPQQEPKYMKSDCK